jgi:hypothetical protein
MCRLLSCWGMSPAGAGGSDGGNCRRWNAHDKSPKPVDDSSSTYNSREKKHLNLMLLSHWQPIQWIPGLFPGVKWLGHGVDHPPSSSARVKERVELYLYSPSGPSWPVLGRTLPFSLFLVARRQYSLFVLFCHL